MYTRAGSTSVFLKTTQGVDSLLVQSGLLVRIKSREFSGGASLLKQIFFRHPSLHLNNSRPSHLHEHTVGNGATREPLSVIVENRGIQQYDSVVCVSVSVFAYVYISCTLGSVSVCCISMTMFYHTTPEFHPKLSSPLFVFCPGPDMKEARKRTHTLSEMAP